jgi:hypothetical protein
MLIQHLYRYLDFTAKLEALVVNRTALGIALGTVGVDLPAEMRFDAYRIYCDEAYHTLFSVDLARQVEAATGVAPVLPDTPYFLHRLAAIQQEAAPEDRALVELLFVIISETLISATLAEVPDSDDVVPTVRETVADHAQDEGRHHAYFAVFLKFLWGQLTRAQRQRAALWVPRLADAFLGPDLAAVRGELTGYGMRRTEVDQVLAETFAADRTGRHRTAMARHTLRYFEELDAFDSQEGREALWEHGFRTPTGPARGTGTVPS